MSSLDDIIQTRRAKIQSYQALGQNPYPTQFNRNVSLQEINSNFATWENQTVAVAGRVFAIREHGKITFFTLQDEQAEIQLLIKSDSLVLPKYSELSLFDIGDILGVKGVVLKSRTGQNSIQVTELHLLAKSLRPLPDDWDGLTDKETRLRKRYLDLIMNPNSRHVFAVRHGILREMRNFFNQKGYTEVEVPILQPLYGGANAKPFTTYINYLDTSAYLKIASELYLKRLLVAGLGGVYDIAKNFRNEGIDQTHYPEFTMLELYIPYANYFDMMNVIEEMTKVLATKVLQSTTLKIHDQEVDLAGSWRKVRMTELIQEVLNIDVATMSDVQLFEYAQSRNLEVTPETRRGELIFALFDKIASKTLVQPTWVYDYPAEISPLAKRKFDQPEIAERFELYVGTKEIYDGWSEMNDPVLQRASFENEAYRKLDEGEITQPIDEDFLEALEYGMPPAAGIGIGIERLTMFFTNTWAIQETILFPFKKLEV
jgi:lysyl-tRNA synthetase class 2